MALNDILRAVHGPGELLPALDMFIVQRKEEDRSGEWHPSGFCLMCAREQVLRVALKKPVREEIISPQTKRIWDIGTAIHSIYQNEYFGPMGILWGKWVCGSCELETWGFRPDGDCVRCRRGGRYTYGEVPVKAKLPQCEKPVVGRSDGILYVEGEWLVLEIKSINQDGCRFLKGPYPSAISQADIYGELIRQKLVLAPRGVHIPTPKRKLVLYVNKNDSTHREFILPLDSEAAKMRLAQPMEFEKGVATKKIPDKWPACVDKTKNPAKKCPMKNYCFKDLTWAEYEGKK